MSIYDSPDFFQSYADMPRSRYGLSAAGEWHQLQPFFPEVTDKSVLDLGCGYGWHCKYAAQMGAASVLGIDSSHLMIEKAQQINAHENVSYAVRPLEDYDYPAETYDLVISNLVLHYIEDLDQVYRKVYQTLKSGGCFLFNIEHPTFTAGIRQEWVRDEQGEALYWPVEDYYYPGPRDTVFCGQQVRKYHHTLTQILKGLLQAGFCIQAVEEAMPPQDMMHLPGMTDEMRRPMMLLVKAGK